MLSRSGLLKAYMRMMAAARGQLLSAAAPVLRSGEWSVVVAQAMAAKVAESRRHLGRVRRLAPEEAAPLSAAAAAAAASSFVEESVR
jgi:hypothetical protein